MIMTVIDFNEEKAPTFTNSTIVSFFDPARCGDLTELLRHDAQQLIAQAEQAEFDRYFDEHQGQRDGVKRRPTVVTSSSART